MDIDLTKQPRICIAALGCEVDEADSGATALVTTVNMRLLGFYEKKCREYAADFLKPKP